MTLHARVGVLVGCSHSGAHVPFPPCLGGPALSHPGVIAGLWGVGFPLPLGGVVLRLELLCLFVSCVLVGWARVFHVPSSVLPGLANDWWW